MLRPAGTFALMALSFTCLGCILLGQMPADRGDLATAYADFELALREYPPPAERLREVSDEFDQVSLQFFRLQFSAAVSRLRLLTGSLRDQPWENDAARLVAGLKATPFPRTYVTGSSARPTVEIGSMFPFSGAASRELDVTVRLRSAEGQVVFEESVRARVEPFRGVLAEIALPRGVNAPPPGAYVIEAATHEGFVAPTARWWVVPRSLDAVRRDNDARLDRIEAATPALAQALAATRARNRLLTDDPSIWDSASDRADPVSLTAEVAEELAALEEGRDPFATRTGDYWRTVRIGDTDVATRIYAPTVVVDRPATALLVALHGAGGDENMFFEGYGAGLIRTLADEHGFIVAAPRTEYWLRNAERFFEFVDALALTYTVDRDHIYVVGHSLGSAAAIEIGKRFPDAVAAIACLAGGTNIADGPRLPPTLVILGERDPISPAARSRAAVERAVSAGLPVELRSLPDLGHTLLVGGTLRDVVAWCLAQPVRTE